MLSGSGIKTMAIPVIVALALLFPPAESNVWSCESNNPDEIPPFLTSGVDPNVLMIIDNSGSMYDLAYVTNAGYCFDGIYQDQGQMVESYQQTKKYAGYFEPDGWYAYDFDTERFLSAAPETNCGTATHRKGGSDAREVCLTISTITTVDGEKESVDSFSARGNYLNWATASKMDIEKGILTGGKHQDGNLIMESRGCVDMRFLRETYIDLAGEEGQNKQRLTLAVRKSTDNERSGNPNDYTTRIEIFPVMDNKNAFDHGPCQDAVIEMRKESPNLGKLKGHIDDCLDYSAYKSNDPEVASQSAFNQSVQTCWFIVKHDDPDSITTGDINRIINSCENVYEGHGNPGVNPVDLDPSHSGYVCYGDHTQQSGYVGRCWNHNQVTWRPNGKINKKGWVNDVNDCVESALLDFCGVINVPTVTDPSDQVTGVGDDTGEFWNLPAMLVDSGVIWQLGQPLAILKGRVAHDDTPSGLLQEFAADLRMGAMVFNWDGAAYECGLSGALGTYACSEGVRDGGRVIASIGKGEEHTQDLVDAVNAIVADTWTPLGEAMFNAIGYFAQDEGLRLHTLDFTIYNDGGPITDWCQLNNILLITDGAPTADRNQDMIYFAETLGYELGSTCPALHGSSYLADLAKYAYEDVWMDWTFPPGEERQPITTHVVAVGDFRDEGADLCSPDMLLETTAALGGTELYKAETLDQLEAALREAFSNIRAGAAAGSAASVISATRSGEGAVYQAIFWPEKTDSEGRMIAWAGEVQALFVDERGRLFEDTNLNRKLDPDDLQVTIFHDATVGYSRACYGVIQYGACTGTVTDISQVKYLWSANDWLSGLSDDTNLELNRAEGSNQFTAQTNPHHRYIFTWYDLNNDGVVQPGEVLDFQADTITELGEEVYKSLGVSEEEEAENLINWLRGRDQAGLRTREIDIKGTTGTWRLGDVIHSTPTAVSRPAEGYHFLYLDGSYARFSARYNNRRHMIYFGGNDGMLHAVNGGFYNVGQKKFCKTPDCQSEENAMPLGAEMWAYVPYNLWPHLRCLADPDYGHKYYVDQVPRVFDVKIFDEDSACSADLYHPDCVYPGGWGTILVGGMRFGGEETVVNNRTFTSSYFILDITNPEKPPKLLAEMTYTGDPNEAYMGFTTSVPTVVPMVVPGEGISEWYLLLGSGPTTLKGVSGQTGRVAVVSLRELINSTSPIPFRIPNAAPTTGQKHVGSFELSGHGNSFVSDLITVDFDLNYLADAVYFGTVSGGFDPEGGWDGGGKVYRLVTEKLAEKLDGNYKQVPSQPHEWATLLAGDGLSNPLPLIDVGEPVTAAPAAAWDGRNYWVYFGTGRLFNREDLRDLDSYSYFGIKEPVDCDTGRFTWETVEFAVLEDGDFDISDNTPGKRGLLRVDGIGVLGHRYASNALLVCPGAIAGTTPCLPEGVSTFAMLRSYIAGYDCESGTDGWYRKFHDNGERNLGQATVLGGLLTYSSYLPSEDPCNADGFSDLYALYYQTGTPWHRPVFTVFSEGDEGVPVEYRQRIGPGLAVTPSLHVGTERGAKAFLQTSTGAIIGIEQPELPHSDYKTGRESWREIYRNDILTGNGENEDNDDDP